MQRAAVFLAVNAALLFSALCLAPPARSQGSGPAAGEEKRRTQGTTAAQGQPPKAVLELYTSQGCSSCPPADALLKSYTQQSDVVALTFHVDYWDYLGWKDTLANAKFSARQRTYAKHRGDGRIYTPQVVVNGLAHANGSVAREIDQAIASQQSAFAKTRIAIQLRAEKTQLVIETGAAPDGGEIHDANLWLAMVQPEATVNVRGGENGGRTLKYFNVVRDLTPIGMWSGKAMTVRLDRETLSQAGAEAYAVLLQSGKGGRIIGAAMLNGL